MRGKQLLLLENIKHSVAISKLIDRNYEKKMELVAH